MGGLYGDGIIGLKGAFDRQWARELRANIDRLFNEALQHLGGALARGPNRFYVEVHPESLTGFINIDTGGRLQNRRSRIRRSRPRVRKPAVAP